MTNRSSRRPRSDADCTKQPARECSASDSRNDRSRRIYSPANTSINHPDRTREKFLGKEPRSQCGLRRAKTAGFAGLVGIATTLLSLSPSRLPPPLSLFSIGGTSSRARYDEEKTRESSALRANTIVCTLLRKSNYRSRVPDISVDIFGSSIHMARATPRKYSISPNDFVNYHPRHNFHSTT